MRSVRLRVLLPIIFGFLALALFAWDYENERVVASMGMGWDTGPPVWPYRAVPSISYAVNAPAYVISWPILKLLDLRTYSLQYAVWFPAILVLWWWVGMYIDFGFLGPESRSWPKLKAGILFIASAVLVFLAFQVCLGEYRWVRDYWKDHPPIYAILLLGAIGSTVWCLFFASVFARAAIHFVRHEMVPSKFNPVTYRAFLFCATILGLNVAGISYLDHVISPPPNPNYCETDRLYRLGCVHGTLTDENEKPVAHIEVNLIPTFKSGDARRFGTKSEWTDKQGRYNFNLTDSGEYILAVNPFESSPGPAKETPYETRYYRLADDESRAERVTVTQPSATNLPPFRLRSSKFTTIEVMVEWEDGSRPMRSDIFVQNTRYWGLVGGFEEIENGVGKIDLAQGFEYVANAQAECAGRDGPEQRLATPSEKFTVADGQTQIKLRLLLLGSPCVLREAH